MSWRVFIQRVLLLALAAALWNCAVSHRKTSPEDIRARSIREFQDRHPGGMILRGQVEDYEEDEYVSGKGVYYGDLWLRVRDVVWVGSEYSRVDAIASRLGSLGFMLKSMIRPEAGGPKVGDRVRVMVLQVPLPLVKHFPPGKEVLIGVKATFKLPLLQAIWDQGGQVLSVAKARKEAGLKPGPLGWL